MHKFEHTFSQSLRDSVTPPRTKINTAFDRRVRGVGYAPRVTQFVPVQPWLNVK